MEHFFLQLVQTQLNKLDLSLDDNFSDMGGNSIDAEMIVSILNSTYSLNLKKKYLFKSESLQEFVDLYLTIDT
jgi:hypothetical protein